MIVIGLDGLEPSIVESMLARGELPHLASLLARGGFTRVATTSPAQTPVAWSTFATGLNPGGHGIYDFLSRDPRTYLPDLSLNRFVQKNAFTPPKVENRRQGEAVWTTLARAGVESTVIRCPCTFPPDELRGELLSGMGVPDLRGGLGTGTFLTTAPGTVLAGEGERIGPIERLGETRFRAAITGPANPRGTGDASVPIELSVDRERKTLTIACAGARPETVTLGLNAWSPWIAVKFKLGLMQSARGMFRVLVRALEPELELYVSPVNFDPREPLYPISEPPGFSHALADDLGPFYTTGMAEDHAGLINGRIDEHAFLAQCDELWDEREAMLLRSLEKKTSALTYCLFDTPDRVQHLFWRFREPDHPSAPSPRECAEFGRTIEAHYQRADAAVGAVLESTGPDDLVIALSDHGFGSFRRCIELNTWLREQGLLRLVREPEPGEPEPSLLRGIDWSRTSAYAVGLGAIYLNLAGREAQGCVAPADAERLERQIVESLTALTDPQNGHRPVRGVRTRRELYRGPLAAESPDLTVHLDRGYRVGWSTGLGGIAPSVFSDNTKRWSGDHIFDPSVVPGVLFVNRPFRQADCHLHDLAPTILDALGVPVPEPMEGSSLLS